MTLENLTTEELELEIQVTEECMSHYSRRDIEEENYLSSLKLELEKRGEHK